eukprot:Skav230567  [mRNA]  locus=scaffold1941:32823:37347:- [translate_table: standard]
MTSEQTPDVQDWRAFRDGPRAVRLVLAGKPAWHGVPLFTLRSENWNERLGAVSAEQELGLYGSYAGLATACNLHEPKADVQCSIRFQTTFLPVQTTEAPGKLEFATDTGHHWARPGTNGHYWAIGKPDVGGTTWNHICPPGSLQLQHPEGRRPTEPAAAVHLAGHGGATGWLWGQEAVPPRGGRCWEDPPLLVGGEQLESATEKATALARGKATSSVIGIKAMGQRCWEQLCCCHG